MKEIQHIIRSIDRDRNGYVTRNELDDILKEVYPELRKKDLMRLIKPFCSVSNKILVAQKTTALCSLSKAQTNQSLKKDIQKMRLEKIKEFIKINEADLISKNLIQ